MTYPGNAGPVVEQALPAAERFHAMDTLRGFAMLLGVFLHAALPYMTRDISWPGQDQHPRMVFDVFVGLVHGFRMQLFFFIAGFFARLLFHRIGEGPFVRHRLKRIGVPFLFGMLLLVPTVHVFWDDGLNWHAPAHLWFLEYLLIYYAVTFLAVRALRRWREGQTLEVPDRWFGVLMGSFWKPLILTVPTAAILTASPFWVTVEKSGASLIPTWPGLLYYGLFYLAGWWVHRQPKLVLTWPRHSGKYLLLALPVFLLAGGLVLFHGRSEHPHYALVKLACDSAWALYAWLMVFGTIGFFVRALNFGHPAIRYVADAAYWIYLAHLPVVLGLQLVLRPYPWDPLVKFALVSGLALMGLFASYHWLVRYSFIGTVLNGTRRHPPNVRQSSS
jgi:glucans biosynthesis protein C